MSITLMISRTFSTGRPYSSFPSTKVRYLPARSSCACAACGSSTNVIVSMAVFLIDRPQNSVMAGVSDAAAKHEPDTDEPVGSVGGERAAGFEIELHVAR